VAALTDSLVALGIDPTYVGRQQEASRIAAMALEHEADTIEICLTGSGGVHLLRRLLRELIETGRRDVRIVVHRVA
jgi:methylmalonyl-CoA mutase cobalamin-binding subunit